MEFTDEWEGVEARVRRLLQTWLGDASLADEVLQQVRIRAWRGYESFQRRATFLTWVVTIAQREAARAVTARRRFVTLDDIPEPAAPESPPAEERDTLSALRAASREAAEAGEFSEVEAAIVDARLSDPTASWTDIGARLGRSENYCAVTFHRAAAKLRVILFLHHQDRLGGRGAVLWGFSAALDAREPYRLTDGQADTFRYCVLASPTREPVRGQREDLRNACQKVALKMELY